MVSILSNDASKRPMLMLNNGSSVPSALFQSSSAKRCGNDLGKCLDIRKICCDLPSNLREYKISSPSKPEIDTRTKTKSSFVSNPWHTISTQTWSKLPFPTHCIHLKIMSNTNLQMRDYIICMNSFHKETQDGINSTLQQNKPEGLGIWWEGFF